jgi:hypothetical protein
MIKNIESAEHDRWGQVCDGLTLRLVPLRGLLRTRTPKALPARNVNRDHQNPSP